MTFLFMVFIMNLSKQTHEFLSRFIAVPKQTHFNGKNLIHTVALARCQEQAYEFQPF